MRRTTALAVLLLLAAACSPGDESTTTADVVAPESTSSTTTTTVPTTTTTELPDLDVSSPAFEKGGSVPRPYTCDGRDISPELNVVGLPEPTEAIALIVEDPDAPLGTWYHWVEFDIPAVTGSYDVARNTPPLGVSGVNSWNLEGYMGPCPPPGEEHEYRFQVFALDSMLGLPPGVDAEEVLAALSDHTVGMTQLIGRYGR